MKNILIILLFATSISSFSQVSFFSNGEEVSELSHKDNNVTVNISIPSNFLNYEDIIFSVGVVPENTPNNNVFDAHVLYKSSYLKNKKIVSEILANSKSNSSFIKQKVLLKGKWKTTYFDLHAPDNLSTRKTNKYKVVVGVKGRNISSYEWKTNLNGNKEQTPVYSYHDIKYYTIPYDAGEVSNTIPSELNTFGLVKIQDGDYRVYGTEAKETFTGKQEEEDYIEVLYPLNNNNKEGVLFKIISYPKAIKNTSFIMNYVEQNLKEMASNPNSSNVFEAYNHGEKIIIPGFGAKGKSKMDIGSLQDKFKGKDNGSSQKTKSNQNWQECVISGIKANRMKLEVYTGWEYAFFGDKGVKKGKEGKTRIFEVYVFEKNNRTFLMFGYKYGENNMMSSDEANFLKSNFEGVVVK